jgi:hypothetical protein
MVMIGKYVPPHMRGQSINQSSTSNATTKPPTYQNGAAQNQKSNYQKYNQNRKLQQQKQKQQKQKKIEQQILLQTPPVKPHCELFLADLPPQMRDLSTLAAFFHPYGEVTHIQLIAPLDLMPPACSKFIKPDMYAELFCAIVEFTTARVAKFVVGVLRKRIEALNFRVGLLKPGLEEEMAAQEARLTESLYVPSYQTINNVQNNVMKSIIPPLAPIANDNLNIRPKPQNIYSSDALSEFEGGQIRQRSILHINATSDGAYWTGSSGHSSSGSGGSDNEHDKRRPNLYQFNYGDSSDEELDLMALAIKNGIKVTKGF